MGGAQRLRRREKFRVVKQQKFVFFVKDYTRGKSAFPGKDKAAGKTICE